MHSRGFAPLFAAIVFVGLAQLLVLPPFEGFDETAHYSSIREIADTGAIPIFGKSMITSAVAEYRRWGPMPYSTVVPFNQNGGWTYQTFAASAEADDAYRVRYRSPGTARAPYQPTPEHNWEAQHPPLYYALVAPIMRATDGWAFNSQFLIVRLVSYLFALTGLVIGLYATLRFFRTDGRSRRAFVLGALLYPFLVPMFVLEFARLGNDSLCALFVGIAWLALLALVDDARRIGRAVWLGLALGMGLLTKAFFLPIASGVCAYLFYRVFASRHERPLARVQLRQALIVTIVALVTGGWWYAYKFVAFHSITGGEAFIALDAQGGLLTNLAQKFSIRYFVRGFAALVASAYYTSTWSLTRLPEALYIPGLALIAWIAGRCFNRLRHVSLNAQEWAPIWIAAPMVGGFVYYILAQIALNASGNNVGGWYLNILAPVLAVLFGLGMTEPIRRRSTRWLIAALAGYAGCFVIAGQWAQAALFAGCAIKTADSKYYVFPDRLYCLSHVGDVSAHLSVIGWPTAAFVCFLAGILSLAFGLTRIASATSTS